MKSEANIHEIARGKWRAILPAVGVTSKILDGKHQACPMCGGEDRFRWDDKGGSGSYFCNGCGSGSGVDLVMKALNVDFKEARRLIMREAIGSPVEVKQGRSAEDKAKGLGLIDKVWKRSHPLNGYCAASKYLKNRGLNFNSWPKLLRFHPAMKYWHDKDTTSVHPCMIAMVIGPEREAITLHYTYLTEDGEKADVKPARKLAPGGFPMGGAVRLANSAPTMGIAEGIETALAAMAMHGVPVWAACTAGALAKFQPPANVEALLIFGDNDPTFAGQAAAYSLAHRCQRDGLHCEVRLPDTIGDDWNDVLQSYASGSDVKTVAAETPDF